MARLVHAVKFWRMTRSAQVMLQMLGLAVILPSLSSANLLEDEILCCGCTAYQT